ncbi:MAG: hypothetical protein M1812_006812 [Candelaria pacifica]|nr:MAG: hypothetical protein M1812_006812 [Candelaria pacifica]
MASHLAWVRSLKSSQLSTIASRTGINSSGTKPILIARLLDELPVERVSSFFQDGNQDRQRRNGLLRPRSTDSKQCRIISIDMGIRNLAYCVLDLSTSFEPEAVTTRKLSDSRFITPETRTWERIAINRNAPLPSESLEDVKTDKKVKEAFDPSTYAAYAYSFVSEVLLPHTPATILIERQRYRSMGSSAVQEWTVRVNMLESMLYAVLKTLSEQGKWTGSVHAVIPAKVGPFWLGDGDVAEKPKTKSAKTKNKVAKIDLVGKWLESGQAVKLSGEAEMMGKAFLGKWRGKGQRMKLVKRSSEDGVAGDLSTEGSKEISKLDDLADCLLQGLAWIRWEENRRKIIKWGPEALTELG